MEIKRVLVIGGFGYIGKEIVLELIKNNYFVTLLSRKKRSFDNCEVIIDDVLNKNLILKNFDIIIYLAAVIRSFNKFKYKENVIGIRNVIEIMNKNNIKKIIYFSTQNVYLNKTGYYGKSKKEAETILKNSSLDYAIIRPNYVYGVDKENYFFQIAKFIKKFRFCFVIGYGENKFQPINKKDVANITLNLLNNFKTCELDLSGNTISINEIINILKEELKINVLIFHLPIRLIRIFKFIIPFDVDGFNEDRVSKQKLKTKFNLRDDLKEIINLI